MCERLESSWTTTPSRIQVNEREVSSGEASGQMVAAYRRKKEGTGGDHQQVRECFEGGPARVSRKREERER